MSATRPPTPRPRAGGCRRAATRTSSSTAALDALALERTLRRDDLRARGFARRLQRRLARNRADAWRLAVGADLRFPATAGPRPFGFALMNRYMGALLALSGKEPVVARRFLEVIGVRQAPAALLAPTIARRVLRRVIRGR